MSKTIKIAGACGFWGDSPYAYEQFLRASESIDYITADYLSEVTLGLLSFRQSKDPSLGFIEEFPQLFQKIAPELKRKNIKLICNAGGLNPKSLLEKLEELDTGLEIACVYGDNIKNSDSSNLSENVYLGASGIVKALSKGAQVIVTGRVVDSALILGALIHEHQWGWNDFDKLSFGSLAGHLIECGAQSTGGNFTDWAKVPNFENIGYPIVEVKENGEFFLTKLEEMGGLVSKLSVSEQLVYEISNPQCYLLPDVTCDWRDIDIQEVGEDKVLVTGAKGVAPVSTYKALATSVEAYKIDAYMTLIGFDNLSKAQQCFESLKKRFKHILKENQQEDLSQSKMTIFGADSQKQCPKDSFEVLLKMSFVHSNPQALKLLTSEFAFLSTSMTPGFTQLIGGRPKPSPLIITKSYTWEKNKVQEKVLLNGQELNIEPHVNSYREQCSEGVKNEEIEDFVFLENEETKEVRLQELCVARSGDKGNHCNIGVVARNKTVFLFLNKILDEKFMMKNFQHLFDSKKDIHVERFSFEKLKAFNFMLYNSLGGGGMNSLRIDPQGKAYAQQFLDIKVLAPTRIL